MKKLLSILLALALISAIAAFPASAGGDKGEAAASYYIVGTMNDWQLRPDYQICSHSDGMTYSFKLFMSPEDAFRIVRSYDGVTPDRSYPEDEESAFNQDSRIITKDGYFLFTFRPACDGGMGYTCDALYLDDSQKEVWYDNCIICNGYEPAAYPHTEAQKPAPATEPGYYIVGNMTDWKLAKHYRLKMYSYTDQNGSVKEMGNSDAIRLLRGDRFKIAYSEDGETVTRLYPEGDGNAYNEDEMRIFHDSQDYYVWFFPGGDAAEHSNFDVSGKPPHYGMIVASDLSMWDCLTPLPIPAKPHTDGMYRDVLLEAFPDLDEAYLDYRELYIHRGADSQPDWACVWASDYENHHGMLYSVLGNRVVKQYFYSAYPFLTHFGIYDIKANRFYDPAAAGQNGFKPENYPDYERVMDEYATRAYNCNDRLLGDLDRDDVIDIIDVTLLQRCEALIREYPEDDTIDPYHYYTESALPPTYYSDFNRDGDRDILDATAIQRYLIRLN